MIFADIPGIGLVFFIAFFAGLICLCVDDCKKRKAGEHRGMPLLFSVPGILIITVIIIALMACGIPYQIALAGFFAYVALVVWKYRKRRES